MSVASTSARQILRSLPRSSFALSSRRCFASSSTSLKAVAGSKLPDTKALQSSCTPGTVMHGLSILKDQPDPIAKADEEYPEWLWTIIPTGKNSDLATQPKAPKSKGGEFDFTQEKRRLRAINKSKIKASNFLKAQ